MLRRIVWSALYAGLSAAAALGARRVASGIWRIAVGAPPPAGR